MEEPGRNLDSDPILDEGRELVATAEGELRGIEAALARLEEQRYGSCEICGEPIGRSRLEAAPTERRCATHAFTGDVELA